MRQEAIQNQISWEKINEPFRVLLKIISIVKSKKRVPFRLASYLFFNSKEVFSAANNVVIFAQFIPLNEPQKLKVFIQNFNTYFDIEDDQKEQKIESTLVFMVELYKWLKIVR